jgi:hypothetical protein
MIEPGRIAEEKKQRKNFGWRSERSFTSGEKSFQAVPARLSDKYTMEVKTY